MAHKPIGLEGIDELLVEYTRRRGINAEGLALLPEGGGWLLAEFGADNSRRSRSPGRRPDRRPAPKPDPPTDAAASPIASRAKRVWEVRESSLGVISLCPRRATNWEGWEDSAVRPGQAGPIPARPPPTDEPLQLHAAPSTATSATAASTPASTSTLAITAGIADFRKFMEAGCRPGRQLRRFALRRAWRRPGAGRTAAQDVRPGIDAGLPRVQSHLGSRPGR